MRIRIVLSDGHHLLREQVIERVNGLAVARQELRHLDVVEFGDHKMHVFDDSLLPEGELALETTVQGAPVLGEKQPGTMRTPLLCGYGLKPMGEAGAEAIPLAHLNTLVGPPGQSALIVRRREKMYLTRCRA
jgi:hypothetical protein